MKSESRTERNKREIRGRILAAATELFDEQGIEPIKVEAICDQANIALRTFYNHFPSKRELVDQLAVDAIAVVAARIRAAHGDGGSTRERLNLFFECCAEKRMQAGPKHKELLGALILVNVGHRNLRAARDAMKALLQEGIDSGDITAGHSAETLTNVVLGTFYRIVMDSASIRDYPIRAQLQEASKFLCDAIATMEKDSSVRGLRLEEADKVVKR
jgi:AcrR family transcriptional regulator